MSSEITLVVDTEPMANSLSGVSHHVDATSAAIVAMKAATVAAEAKAAEKICENVTLGFHSLLLSQVSQKCAKAKSVVDAKFQELFHLETNLRRVREQMERDFHRIAARYLKIFSSLDAALHSRVRELDQAAVELSGQQMPLAMARVTQNASRIPLHQKESLTAMQALSATVTRRHADEVIGHIQGFLDKSSQLQTVMNAITDTVYAEAPETVFLPAVLFEADGLNASTPIRNVRLPRSDAGCEAALMEAFPKIRWRPSDAMSQPVRHQVEALAAKACSSERVSKTMLDLLARCKWNVAEAYEK